MPYVHLYRSYRTSLLQLLLTDNLQNFIQTHQYSQPKKNEVEPQSQTSMHTTTKLLATNINALDSMIAIHIAKLVNIAETKLVCHIWQLSISQVTGFEYSQRSEQCIVLYMIPTFGENDDSPTVIVSVAGNIRRLKLFSFALRAVEPNSSQMSKPASTKTCTIDTPIYMDTKQMYPNLFYIMFLYVILDPL